MTAHNNYIVLLIMYMYMYLDNSVYMCVYTTVTIGWYTVYIYCSVGKESVSGLHEWRG